MRTGYELTASEMLDGYRTGQFSPREVMQSVLDRAETVNGSINALIFIDAEAAMAAAAASTERWGRGEPSGALDGVPITVKDSIAESSRPMLRGLAANRNARPSGYDSPPSARLKEAGAIIWAKTTMPDFGLLPYGVSSAYGITRNPWKLDATPGGSSSGAAASVAARCGPLALGSDIGGSVRLPAALCGLVGLKPTQGRIPHLPPSPIRSVGPLSRTAQDAALLLDVISKSDPRDYGSLPPETGTYSPLLAHPVNGLRIGLALEGFHGDLPAPAVLESVQAAARVLEQHGAQVDVIRPAVATNFMQAAEVIFLMRGACELAHLSSDAREQVPEAFRRWFDEVNHLSAFDVGLALEQVDRIKMEASAQIAEYDYLLTPIVPLSHFPADSATPPRDGDPILEYLPIWNQTGHPAVSVCCGFDETAGVPIGMQIIGQRFDDRGVLELAAFWENVRDFDIRWPL